MAVVKQREYLLRTGKSKIPEVSVITSLDQVKRQLEAFNYNDVNMARFVTRNKENIRAILPGYGASSHMVKQNQYRELMQEARGILTEPIKIEFDAR